MIQLDFHQVLLAVENFLPGTEPCWCLQLSVQPSVNDRQTDRQTLAVDVCGVFTEWVCVCVFRGKYSKRWCRVCLQSSQSATCVCVVQRPSLMSRLLLSATLLSLATVRPPSLNVMVECVVECPYHCWLCWCLSSLCTATTTSITKYEPAQLTLSSQCLSRSVNGFTCVQYAVLQATAKVR